MMSCRWINLTHSVTTGIKLINTIDTVKFPLLLSRIFNSIQNKNDTIFTDNELAKLEESLHLKSEELQIMLNSIIYITKQSKYFLMKPTTLHEDLINKLHFNSDKAETFVKYWTENTKLDFEDLQSRKQLQSVLWELNLETASNFDLKNMTPTSLVQFKVTNAETEIQNITMEMNEQQLLQMYNDIEEIQNCLDNMNK